MATIKYQVEQFYGLNVYEIERLIKSKNLPFTIEPHVAEYEIVYYILIDNETGQAWEAYFGGHCVGHFNEPLLYLRPIDD